MAKREKLDSSTNVYLFPMLAPSLNSLLLPSQREAVISLAPECVCTPTVEIFFDEKQYVVLCRGCLSFIALHSVNRKSLGDGIDSLSPPLQLHARTPAPPKQSFHKLVMSEMQPDVCVRVCACVCLPVVHCNQSKACCHTNLTPHTARRGGGGGERL